YPVIWAGEGAPAMLSHRRGSSTLPDNRIRDPKGGFASPPAALPDTCDARHHGVSRALPDELAKPSYGYHLLDSIH
ncbi:MAG: hypothetical protein ACTSX7_10070, partial [Alphaproteobacteria bacterium]